MLGCLGLRYAVRVLGDIVWKMGVESVVMYNYGIGLVVTWFLVTVVSLGELNSRHVATVTTSFYCLSRSVTLELALSMDSSCKT